MRDQKNRLLLACFAVSLALYFALFWVDMDYRTFGSLQSALLLSFHAVPAFCLQALLCRTAKWNWVKFIPLGLLFLAALVGTLYLYGVWGTGWDTIAGALILTWELAPAAGCCLGWMYAGHKLGRWAAAAGWTLLLAIYIWLKDRGGPLRIFDFEPIDLAALIVLIAGLWLLFRKPKQNTDSE